MYRIKPDRPMRTPPPIPLLPKERKKGREIKIEVAKIIFLIFKKNNKKRSPMLSCFLQQKQALHFSIRHY